MARNTSVVLDDQTYDLVSAKVGAGGFVSPAEVVRAGVRLLEEQERAIRELQAAIVEAEQSGPAKPFDGAAFLVEMHAKHGFWSSAKPACIR